MSTVPQHNQLMWPALKAIKALGGSGTNSEIVQKVIELENISEEAQNELHQDGPKTKLEYRLAWARSYLRIYGALENSERGVWSITDIGEQLTEEQIDQVVYQVRKKSAQKKPPEPSTDDEDNEELNWKNQLLEILKNKLTPAGFERLVQRILRESGFVEVEVTGKPGDEGIDGFGVLRVGLLSFRVIFQCKRYKETVGPNYIRDFRGAMQGRADKGLFMTTGSFTAAAKKEALRDGAPPIDLFDGNDICELIKELKLGINVEVKEEVTIKQDWFQKF